MGRCTWLRYAQRGSCGHANPSGDSDPNLWCSFDNRLFFRTNGTTAMPCNNELWVSDGTDTGTHIFKKLASFRSYPIGGSVCGGKLLFSAEAEISAGTADYYLWATDGSDTGTHPIIPFSAAWDPIVFNDKLYFGYKDSDNNPSLWVSDGTHSGTYEVTNRVSPAGPIMAGTMNNTLYFSGTERTSENAMWATDGTDGGSMKIPLPGSYSYIPFMYGGTFFVYDSALYFPAVYDASGVELYKYAAYPPQTIFPAVSTAPLRFHQSGKQNNQY